MVVTNKKRTIFYVDRIIDAKIEKFQHQFGFVSKSRAIAWLVAWALSQKPTPPPQNDEYYD